MAKKYKEFDYKKFIEDEKIIALLDHHYGWYENKAKEYKNWFYFFSLSTIILNGSIPILNTFNMNLKLWVTIISSIVTIINGGLLLFNLQEKKIRYRNSAEQIKLVIMSYYRTQLEIEEIPDKEKEKKLKEMNIRLLKEIENICREENNRWVEVNNKGDRDA